VILKLYEKILKKLSKIELYSNAAFLKSLIIVSTANGISTTFWIDIIYIGESKTSMEGILCTTDIYELPGLLKSNKI
jgi:hypothetical protein